jgi:hypothetical protein
MRSCPACESKQIANSHRQGFWEIVCLPLMVRRPLRCRDCLYRFYGFSFDAGTRARMRMSLLMLLAVMGLSWGIWKLIEAVGSGLTRPTPSGPMGPGRRR